VHLAFVLGLIFLVFAAPRRAAGPPATAADARRRAAGRLAAGLACRGIGAVHPLVFEDLAFRVGNPGTLDVVMGSILIVALLEATRRSMGWPLPLIAIGFMASMRWRARFPGPAQARRRQLVASWSTTSTSPARASTAWRWAWSPPTSSTSCCSA
jgi:TRAP-type uncharacterized transport system fused permease subunit